jgi:hypothetical protein
MTSQHDFGTFETVSPGYWMEMYKRAVLAGIMLSNNMEFLRKDKWIFFNA